MNSSCAEPSSGPRSRRTTVAVKIGEGSAAVTVGGGAPIVVQSMTNTDTADVEATARQVAALARAGSELVRLTVDRDEAAAAVPRIRERLATMGVNVPLIGDFHYIGHKLLADHPACAEALDKYRINPGNVGFRAKRDLQFGQIIEIAIRNGKTVRIGANWGSLDQELLTHLMDENAASATPLDTRAVTREAMVQSALLSAERAETIGLPRARVILSAKVSAVQDLIAVYRTLAVRSNYALHLGLTEAGMGSKGIRRLLGGPGGAVAGGNWRHHPNLVDARAGRRPDAGGAGRPGAVADHGFSRLCASGRGMPRLRAYDLDRFPGACP